MKTLLNLTLYVLAYGGCASVLAVGLLGELLYPGLDLPGIAGAFGDDLAAFLDAFFGLGGR